MNRLKSQKTGECRSGMKPKRTQGKENEKNRIILQTEDRWEHSLGTTNQPT